MLEARFSGRQTALATPVSAEVVRPGTPEHREALCFQQERFARVSRQDAGAASREDTEPTFVAATDYAPTRTVPIVVRRRAAAPDARGPLLAVARVELPGATVIERMIRLRPGTAAEQALRAGKVAEIGGFATPTDLDRATLLDVIDAIVAVVVQVAEEHNIDWLWFFPRKGFISVMRAEIPGVLPPYRLSYCADWLGWDEGSPQLQRFRALNLRGVPTQPQIFQIARDDFATDLAARQTLLPRRAARAGALERLLIPAMWQAQRDINQEIVSAHGRGEAQGEASRTAVNPDFPQPGRVRSEQ